MGSSSDNDLVRRALEMERGRRSGPNVSLPCPLPACDGKRKPNLSVHDAGPWHCHRCGASGFLTERGDPKLRRAAQTRGDQDRRERTQLARDIFEIVHEIQPGDPVDRYLRGRGLRPIGSAWWPSDLRIGQSRHPSEPSSARWGAYRCMVAAVRNAAGELVAIHRTWVTDDGKKAPLDPVKMALGPTSRAAVRLGDGHEILVTGEGIETTMAAALRTPDPDRVTPWAALHAEGLRHLELPAGCKQLWVAVDMDEKGRNKQDVFGTHDKKGRLQFGSTGIEAAYQLMRRARAAGVDARLLLPYGKDHAE